MLSTRLEPDTCSDQLSFGFSTGILVSQKKMDSFTSFILADPDHRGPMVRKLTFAMPDYEECYKESPYMIKLSNAVRYMRSVTTLCMWGVEAWSRLHHGLVDVLADLPCIQDLHLSSQWNEDFELPHRRTSRPHSLSSAGANDSRSL